MSATPALELRGISKSFGSVQALRGADFVLAPGKIHALLGENGAGKSTLLHVAYGMIPPDRGVLRIAGRETVLASPRGARAAGIGMVHQHFTSIGAFTVAENIALATGRLGPMSGDLPDELLEGLNPDARVETLGVVLRQRLEIAKALVTGAKVLLLDEPTAVLAPQEVEQLLDLLRRLARGGAAIALVTHKLSEVLAVADRVTVLRNGAVVWSGAVAEQTAEGLAQAMIGTSGPLAEVQAARSLSPHPPAVAATALVQVGDFRIGGGELIGVAAVEGNGQRELLRGIAGVDAGPIAAGPVVVRGSAAFVPEDRSTEGLIAAMSLTENIVLGLPGDPRWTRGARIDWRSAKVHTARLIQSFDIRAPGPGVPAGALSGGNQQKLILARALDGNPRVLVAENPTRGLDLRATAEIHARLRAAARTGVAVIFYSTDLDEVLELAGRVIVVHAGRITEAPPGADRRMVGALMLGLPGR